MPYAGTGIVAVILALGAYALWAFVRKRRSALPTGDERTRRASERAAYYALLIGQYCTLAILWVLFVGTELYEFPEVGAMPALIATVLIDSLLFMVLSWYFVRKEHL